MRDQILRDIRRIAAENGGRPPGRDLFERDTGIRHSEWLGVYWARWGDAIKEAGLEPNSLQARIPEAQLLTAIVEACRHFGRIPTTAEIRLYGRQRVGFPSHNAISDGLGGQPGIRERLREMSVGDPDLTDIAAMLPEAAIQDVPARRPGRRDGFVYLIKSGAFYKIGRSDEVERRVKEIRIALPEAASLVHAISTDDPAGIEAYWHRRFADRRANGEWFKLSTADIAAFKRRRFM